MSLITVLFIAIGLSMDAFAVSVTSGFAIKNLKANNAFKIAFFFGAFQAMMPVVGWLAGAGVRDSISSFDHWIAFGLLSIIGCKMIFESTKMKEDKGTNNPLNLYTLLILSVATSIDDDMDLDTYSNIITVNDTSYADANDTLKLQVRVQPDICEDGIRSDGSSGGNNLDVDIKDMFSEELALILPHIAHFQTLIKRQMII